MKHTPWQANEVTTHHGRILIGVAATVLVLVACAGDGETVTTTGPRDSNIAGRLLYEVYEGGDGVSLFVMDAVGGLSEDLGVFTDPGARWSPDSSRILVSSTAGPADTAKPYRPATVATDGSDFRLLDGVDDDTLNLACTAFSPDGSLLACLRYSDFEIGVSTIRASDGGVVRALTDFNGVPGDFSPAGDEIVFLGGDSESTSFAGNVGTLYVVGAEGTNLREITEPNSVLGYSFGSWAPDGEWIVFIGADGTLSLVHPDGTEVHKVTLPAEASIDEALGATWSPDGEWIAFSARAGGGDNPDIYLVRPDGTDLRQVTETPDAEFVDDWAS
jgi:Tol biopolymer transport system component